MCSKLTSHVLTIVVKIPTAPLRCISLFVILSTSCLRPEQSRSHLPCLNVGPELSSAPLLGPMSRGIGIQPKLSAAQASPGAHTVIMAWVKQPAPAGNWFLF